MALKCVGDAALVWVTVPRLWSPLEYLVRPPSAAAGRRRRALWSDAFVHAIHQRVLVHVKHLAEGERPG